MAGRGSGCLLGDGDGDGGNGLGGPVVGRRGKRVWCLVGRRRSGVALYEKTSRENGVGK